MLIPAGAAIALALVLRRLHLSFRNAAGDGLIANTVGFVFVSVGGAGLIANLIKNILGRARPKLFDSGGPLDFNLFAFMPDYASFPSGHAISIFAFATVIGILWPRARAALHGGSLGRAHKTIDRRTLFHGRRGGRDPRHRLPIPGQGALCRPPLVV